jgi:hypothetical protein
VAFFLQAFRNSIGDLAPPSYEYWEEMKSKGKTSALVMIYMIWGFWLFQIVSFTILLLNFLIAVISQSYE